jgi:DNA-binding transcriptional MerR regulator
MVNYIAREVEKLADDLGIDRKRSIGEVARELKVATHVIRFWEENFAQIKPEIGPGKRRYYYNRQVKVLKRIKKFLHEDGYTVAGLQKLLRKRRDENSQISDLDIILNQPSSLSSKPNQDVGSKIPSENPEDLELEIDLESESADDKNIDDFIDPQVRVKTGVAFDPKASMLDFAGIRISAIDIDIQKKIEGCVARIKENLEKLRTLKV